MTKIILLLLVPFFVLAQTGDVKSHFTGKWKIDSDKTEMFEHWVIVNDNELSGESYVEVNGTKEIIERLCLKKIGDYWLYIAVPAGQTPTLFVLTDITDNKFIFVNEEHDFPQKVIYYFHGDGKLTAAIEGVLNGKTKRNEFNFISVSE
ncbi:MAG: hypothetical protein IPM56_08680 [Ignavibacteriales bacterium]|nr:MAG: hypothetical protein IPM56_08680 [Ignavibacteriales bacterium]